MLTDLRYFPYGVYVVLSTLFIPPGSRIVGEAWPVISGAGAKFRDANNPVPVVKVGNANDVGVAQISDMRFTVAEPLAGAKIMEWNMAGASNGDVGIWNSIVNIGGMRDSTVSASCQSQNPCQAAHTGMHLTSTSSVYVQNGMMFLFLLPYAGTDHRNSMGLDGGPRRRPNIRESDHLHRARYPRRSHKSNVAGGQRRRAPLALRIQL